MTTTHKTACPRRYNPIDDCMCDYIQPRRKNGSRLINKAHVRKLALESNPKFTRVAQSFFDAVDRLTADHVRKLAGNQRRGVTLK